MDSRTLWRRAGYRVLHREITWEGCDVEIADWSAESEGDTSTRTFPTPLEALEFVEEQVAKLIAEGWQDREPPRPAQGLVEDRTNEELENLIVVDPDNTGSYLVYADWLQSQGSPRGELITIQHALTQERTPELELAESSLLSKHSELFFGSLGDTPELFEVEWHLGFIRYARFFLKDPSSVGLDDVALVRSFLSASSSRHLRHLVLHEGPRTSERTGYIRALVESGTKPLLHKLQLGLPYSVATIVDVDIGSVMPQLRELALFGRVKGLANIEIPELRKLTVASLGTGKALPDLSRIPRPKLTHLSLSLGYELLRSTNEFREFCRTSNFPRLRHLVLSDYGASHIDELLRGDLLSNLETLELRQPFQREEALRLINENPQATGHLEGLIIDAQSDRPLLDRIIGPDIVIAERRLHEEYRYSDIYDSMEEEDDDDDENERRKYGDLDGFYDDHDFQIYAYGSEAAQDSWESEGEEPEEEPRDVDEDWENLDRDDPFDLDDET